MCGVFGIRAPGRDVARLAYFGLHALQHRGQESAGIAVSDGGRLTVLRDLGLVAQVFDERTLSGLQGELAIGHTRYSTTGANAWANAQPLLHHGPTRTVAVGHNGNLVNVEALQERAGSRLASTSDSEVIAALVANDERPLTEALARTMRLLQGAATVVGLAEGKLFAFRDRHGFRPLVLGTLDGDPVVASESCALDLVGARLEREVRPGELVIADDGGVTVTQAVPEAQRSALCIFEFFYLARPIQPEQGMREQGIRMKFNPLAEVAGKRLVVVDDSIIRGSTTRQIVGMLFDAGAAEVHLRVSAPPVVSPCFYGMDFASEDEMIAARTDVEGVRAEIGATSLAYLSLEGLQAATRRPESALCRACLTRDYPTAVPVNAAKDRFESAPA